MGPGLGYLGWNGEDLAFSRCNALHPTALKSWSEEKMNELQEERKAQLGDVSGIVEKRDALGKEIQAPSGDL